MSDGNETVAEIVKEMRSANVLYGANDSSRPMTQFEKALLRLYSDRIEAAHKREILFEIKLSSDYLATKDIEIERLTAQHTSADARKNAELDDLRAKLKVAEGALTDLQSRLVASVYDGSVNPHEALKVIEDALAAIREKGGAE